MVRNLPESSLYAKLPETVITLDERGLVAAVVDGVQDRVDDLRSYTGKLAALFDPAALPDGARNVVLVDLQTQQGIVYTRSLDLLTDTPSDAAPEALRTWAAAQLGLAPETLLAVRYGRDLHRLVDADIRAYLAETLGAVLHQTDLATAAGDRALLSSYFPRLRIKGTARSFEVLGRLLGFDDLAFVPLWSRVSPRRPNDPGHPDNHDDFQSRPEFTPQAALGPAYDPHVMRDGPFHLWSGTCTNDPTSTRYYSQVINGHNPWFEVSVNATVNGTTTPAIHNGTAAHIAEGVYIFSGGAPHTQAFADPVGSSFRLRALGEGDSWNGLSVKVYESGTFRVLEVEDQLSAIKYRSSHFDLHIVTDWDRARIVFGERSARANTDLQANPNLTPDGPAVSPYRPWTDGHVTTGTLAADWLVRTGYQAPTVVEARVQADATRRELPFEAVLAGAQQVAGAADTEVRPATRLARRTATGFRVPEDVTYASYLSRGLLFTTTTGTHSYAGSHARTPQPGYIAELSVEPPPILQLTWASEPGRAYEVRATPDLSAYTVIGEPVGSSGTTTQFLVAVVSDYAFFFVHDGPTGTVVTSSASVASNVAFKAALERDTTQPSRGLYRYQDETLTNLKLSGSYDFETGQYDFLFVSGAPANADVYALWTPTDTEVIRDEPTPADKALGHHAYQARPEDVVAVLSTVAVSEYPWARPLSGDGERLDADHARPEPGHRLTVSDTPAVLSQTGVAHDLWVVPSSTAEAPRWLSTPRPTDQRYQPGARAVAWRGTFRDLAQYTEAQHAAANTETDLETLFEPGYGIYLAGLVQGVLVADPGRFFGAHHRDGLVGWLPLHAHPEEALTVRDHVRGTAATLSGIRPQDRLWDADRGWYLHLRPHARIQDGVDRGVGADATLSVWFRPGPAGGLGTTTLLRWGPLRLQFHATTGALEAQGLHTDGTWVSLGLAVVTDWTFLTLRRNATHAFFGVGQGGPALETGVLETWALPDPAAPGLEIQAGNRGVDLHDLRLWSVCKTPAALEQVRAFTPTPTQTLYPPAWVPGVGAFDRYGLKVLANGWIVPAAMPPWARRAEEVVVCRYASSGAYTGTPARKAVGWGGGLIVPADVGAGPAFELGFAVPPPRAHGAYVTAGTHGILPAAEGLWVAEDLYPDYIELSGGSTAAGSLAVERAWAPVYWPHAQGQTNAAVDAVWLQGDDGWVYRVTLSGSTPATLAAEKAGIRGRSDGELAASPLYSSLVNAGTYWDGVFSGSLPPGGPATVTDGVVTTTLELSRLAQAEVFAEAVTSLRVAGVGVRVAATGSSAGWLYQGPVGGPASPPWWLYRTARTVADRPNAWTTWVYGQPGYDATRFGNSVAQHPEVPYPIAALDTRGQLDFEETTTLTAGRYRLVLDVGNIGHPDADFDGFAVELSLNGTPWVPAQLLAQARGYNLRGQVVQHLEVPAGTPPATPWILSLRWLNSYRDARRGVGRQLVVYGYRLEKLEPELYKIEVDETPGAVQPQLTFVTPAAGTHDSQVTGGWLQTYANDGVLHGYQHELNVFAVDETGTYPTPAADLLSASTGERAQALRLTGLTGSTTLPDDVVPGMPSTGTLTATAAPGGLVPLWLWSGALGDGTVVVRAKMPLDSRVRLAYSTDPGLVSPQYTAPVEASRTRNNHVAHFRITGLEPWTPYHYAVETAGTPALSKIGRFTAVGHGPASFRFAMSGCSFNIRGSASNKIVYDAIVDEDPLFLVHTGDLHYNNIATNSEDLFEDALDAVFVSSGSYTFQTAPSSNVGSGRQEALWRQVPVHWVWDDHDYGPNDSDRTSPSRSASATVYRRYSPHFPLQAGGPDAAIYHSYRIGRCVFIVTDNRSERSPKSDPDDAAKVVLGPVQLAWFQAQVLAAARDPDVQFIFWINTLPWIGAPDAGADTWQGYTTQRQAIVDWLAAEGVTRLFILAGDMHACALDDGSGSPGGLPVFHAGPLDQTSSHKGGPYLIGPYPTSTGVSASQYGIVEIVDNGTGTPTVTFTGYNSSGAVLTDGSTDMTLTLNPAQSPYVP